MQRGNMEAYQQPRSVAERLLPWRREPAAEKMQSSNGEMVVYEGKKQTGRKVTGEIMVWGGLVYAGVNVLAGNWGHAAAGAGTSVAGLWVRPKEGQ